MRAPTQPSCVGISYLEPPEKVLWKATLCRLFSTHTETLQHRVFCRQSKRRDCYNGRAFVLQIRQSGGGLIGECDVWEGGQGERTGDLSVPARLSSGTDLAQRSEGFIPPACEGRLARDERCPTTSGRTLR